MTSESIRDEIKNRINISGMKQKKIAEIAGYKEKEFSNILKGRKRMNAVDVFRISQALGITPNELFGITNNPQKGE